MRRDPCSWLKLAVILHFAPQTSELPRKTLNKMFQPLQAQGSFSDSTDAICIGSGRFLVRLRSVLTPLLLH